MSGIVDFHSHILPGIDDGSRSLEESLAMLRMAGEQGIRHMIATPHFYPQHDTPARFLEKRDAAAARLREEMARHGDLPQVSLGAEVYFFYGISESEALSQLTICGKRCILIEMPFISWTDEMYRELESIYTQRGITPIIAHIDRYIRPWNTHGILRRLAQLPVLVQANAEFFLEKGVASMAMRMLRADQIHLLGSDCHNLSTRKPGLGIAIEQIRHKLGDEPIKRIQQYENEVLGFYEPVYSRLEGVSL